MPKINFNELKKRITITQVLEHYGLMDKMKKSGGQLRSACNLPEHQGSNNQAFSVNIEKNCFQCFGCKAHGNILDFVMAMEKCESVYKAGQLLEKWFCNTVEPVKKLVHTDSKKKESPVSSVANEPLQFALKNLECGHPYLLSRVVPETIKHFGLGFCNKGMHKERIVVPIHNLKGELVAYAGRAIDKATEETEGKYKFPANFKKGLELFNLWRVADFLRDGKALILVEGFFDVFRLYELGYTNIVALMGSALSDEQEGLLKKVLTSKSHLFLLFDSDEAGLACTKDVLTRMGWYCFVRAVSLPDRIKQPDELQEKIKFF